MMKQLMSIKFESEAPTYEDGHGLQQHNIFVADMSCLSSIEASSL
jgi:hypothetical protein